MRAWIMMAAALLSLLGTSGEALAQKGLTRISDAVYAYVGVAPGTPGNRFGVNAGIVVGDDAVLVVDTMTSAREAEQFARDIRQVTDKPIRYVVDTHYHLDHALGNCVFADMGARIIAHQKCRDLLAKEGPALLKNAAAYGLEPDFWDGTRLVVPDITFAREIVVDLGNMPVRVFHSGYATHTPDSVMVSIPGQDALFTGDILFNDFHPYLGEGDLQGWNKTLDQIAAMHVGKIIPGHGPLSDARSLGDMKAYLPLFDLNARKLSKTIHDPKALAAEMLRRLPRRKDGAFIVDLNLAVRYAPKTPARKQ